MKNLKTLLPIIMMAPLLMANSPAPFPNYEEYSSVEVQAQKLADLADNTSRFQLDIKNVGENYAFLPYKQIECASKKNGSYYFEAYRQSLFDNEAIAPGKTQVYFVETFVELDKLEEPTTWYLSAYSLQDTNVTFSNFNVTKIDKKQYQLSYKADGLGDYYYAYIIDATYKEKEYSFVLDFYGSSYFYTAEELDLDKLTISGIHAYRTSYNTYKGGYAVNKKEIIPVVVIVAVSLVVALALGITIPCVVVYRKKRKQQDR